MILDFRAKWVWLYIETFFDSIYSHAKVFNQF